MCKHPAKELHIGKSSAGWSFTFHYVDEYDSPDGVAIDSWKRWQEILTRHDVKIWNEYDEPVYLANFIQNVEAKKAEPRNHHLHCLHKYGSDDGYLDEEGHSFSRGIFS